jgi:H/ACA ribonucleoprotein complex subunit 4
MSSPVEQEELIILSDDKTNDSFGYYPDRRPLRTYLEYGFIELDKPRGPSSHEVVAWVRKMLQMEKAGHSGTLDPGVSGLLPIALGNATKALGLLLLGSKEYVSVVRIHNDVPQGRLEEVLQEFLGQIYQRPPQKSSVKRVVRPRTLYQIELMEKVGRLLLIKINCEAGTYIRKLVYDIGEVLGVGATMVELRRTRVFNLDESIRIISLHEISAAIHKLNEENDEIHLRSVIQPIENILSPFKKIIIRDSAVDAVCHGALLAIPGIAQFSSNISKDDLVVILSLKGELIALGKATLNAEEMEEKSKGISAKIERVIMVPGTYPKMWKSSKVQSS